jgi:hypothetical protein
MKKIFVLLGLIFLIVVILFSIDNKKNIEKLDDASFSWDYGNVLADCVEPNQSEISAPYRKHIDTVEFIKYWKYFTNSLLKCDTVSFASIVADSIKDCWFLVEEYAPPSEFMPKSLFIESVYNLFTPTFLSLIKKYDIKKDLFLVRDSSLFVEGQNLVFEKKDYHCEIDGVNMSYNCYIRFNNIEVVGNNDDYNAAVFYIDCFRDTEEPILSEDFLFVEKSIGRIENITFRLFFMKESERIVLYKLDFVQFIGAIE